MLLWITQLHPPLTTSKASSQGPLSMSSSPLPLSSLSCILDFMKLQNSLPTALQAPGTLSPLCASGLVPLAIQMIRMLKGREGCSNNLRKVTVPT